MKNIIHHKTLREQVADAIRKKILYHELEPGMRITESELATNFGVSHGPVREALRQLEQEGLVVYTRNVGCSVRDISFHNVIEARLIRGSYELTAARACAGNISDHGMQEMASILDYMKDMDGSDFTEPIIYDNKFHTVLFHEAPMPYLTIAWSSLDFATFFTFYQQTDQKDSVTHRQYDVHKEIYDIYLSKDCKAICNMISRHYRSSIEFMTKERGMTEADFPFSFDIIDPSHFA